MRTEQQETSKNNHMRPEAPVNIGVKSVIKPKYIDKSDNPAEWNEVRGYQTEIYG